MAIKKITLGSLVNFHQYDNGDFDKSITVEDPIKCAGVPVDNEDVLRLEDIGGIDLAAVSVANIDDPSAELNLLSGTASSLVLAYQTTAGANDVTLYTWDSAIAAGENVPWVVDGSSGYWIAIGGKYSALSQHVLGPSKFGSSTDYTEVEDIGFIVHEGAARFWDDMQWGISSGKVPAANFPDYDTFTTNTKEFNFDVDDYINLSSNEVPHGWNEGTDISIHLHLTIGISNVSGSDQFAKFTVYIAYADVNEVWTETSLTAELTIPDGTAAMTHTKLGLGNLTLTNNLIGTHIKPTIKRIAATGGTEYPNHIFITQLGGHAHYDTSGSRQSTTK